MRIQTTQPIRRIEDIDKIKAALKSQRDVVMFTLGINSALRISDIICRKCSDFKGNTIEIREGKTGKIKVYQMSTTVAKIVNEYIQAYPREWLLPSRQGGGHISRTTAFRIIKDAAVKLGWEHISPHSMRKTFGYQAYKMGAPAPCIMEAFNHSSWQVSKRYLGITQDELNDEIYSKMAL